LKRVEITRQQRQWILKRDNYTFQLCGKIKRGRLHVHHIIAFSYAYFLGWSMERINNPTNLITLCVPCHQSIHLKERWDIETENKLAEIALQRTLRWKRRK